MYNSNKIVSSPDNHIDMRMWRRQLAKSIRADRVRWVIGALMAVIFIAGIFNAWWQFEHPQDKVAQSKARVALLPDSLLERPPQVTATPTPMSTPTPTLIPTVAPAPTLNPSAIKASLQKIIDAHPELYIGASFINLNNGANVDINGDHIFVAASTTKVFIACLLLSRIEAGKYSLESPLGGGTLRSNLQQMINRSNNDAWMALMGYIGYAEQPKYAQKIGISTYNYQDNLISPNDAALLLSKLYSGQLLNKEHTSLLLSYMQKTNMEELIPPAVTAGKTFYHKYGIYTDNLHDTAIIDDAKNPYVLTIYTSQGKRFTSFEERVEIFHQLVGVVEQEMGTL